MSSGILSFGIGVVFAASFVISNNLLTLFRVPIVTGIMVSFICFCNIMKMFHCAAHAGMLQFRF